MGRQWEQRPELGTKRTGSEEQWGWNEGAGGLRRAMDFFTEAEGLREGLVQRDKCSMFPSTTTHFLCVSWGPGQVPPFPQVSRVGFHNHPHLASGPCSEMPEPSRLCYMPEPIKVGFPRTERKALILGRDGSQHLQDFPTSSEPLSFLWKFSHPQIAPSFPLIFWYA